MTEEFVWLSDTRIGGCPAQDQDYFDRLPEACDDENDMLDLAFGLTDM